MVTRWLRACVGAAACVCVALFAEDALLTDEGESISSASVVASEASSPRNNGGLS